MKRIVFSAVLLALASFSVNVCADETGKERGKKRGDAAQGERDGVQRDGQRRIAGMRNRAAAARDAAQRDPAVLVERMMKEFDKDGDQKLDVKELTALMTSMRERRGGQPRGGQGRTDAARGRRGGSSDGQADKGGARPKRPE